MGYSASAAALDNLKALIRPYEITGSGNEFIIDGKTYFYEVGKEQRDGAVVGTVYYVWKEEGKNSWYKPAGTFRIEPDGTITRFPFLKSKSAKRFESHSSYGGTKHKGWHGEKLRHRIAAYKGKRTVRQLPIAKIGNKQYFVDKRLHEMRNVYNPHERLPLGYTFGGKQKMTAYQKHIFERYVIMGGDVTLHRDSLKEAKEVANSLMKPFWGIKTARVYDRITSELKYETKRR